MARKRRFPGVPTFDKLIIPTLQALQNLGGSGTIEEINSEVYEITKLPEEILQIPHKENGNISKIDYRLAWSRTYLKKYGLLENSSRGVWALLKPDINILDINPEEIKNSVRKQAIPNEVKNLLKSKNHVEDEVEDEVEETEEWKEKLLNILYNISPSAFERLSQRILRESGFFQVEVTGKSGDGGIDGKGIVRVSGLLSFHVIFQCKRYKGSINPSQIRDFRGAMQGRADKGLFITTGNFTREALKEATRDGAPPIDLVEGDLLCEKLKELNLGVTTKIVESIEINKDWFLNL
ncbi:restriction endonuclease [Flavobacterium sp. MK4S-17]|uniref:restriction endonuclease n=1 Tax=Flavobacterium sp. MK4S-17 TaxID=2543737 RepID=UPI001358BBB9|nr:restriction endonuclease [Flavobacterium sp. MK4S-17]